MHKTPTYLPFVFILLAACSSDPVLESGDIRVELTDDRGLVVSHGGNEVLVSNSGVTTLDANERPGEAYAPFAAALTDRVRIEEVYGTYAFNDLFGDYSALTVTDHSVDDDVLSFELGDAASGSVAIEDGHVVITWTHETNDRLAMTFNCLEADKFFGLGAQVSIEHRGHRVPVWVQEQGNGKANRGEEPVVFGLSGSHYQSYAPVPFVMMSRPLGVQLDTTWRSEYEMCESADHFRLEIFSKEFKMRIYPGDSVKEVMETYTAETGRARPVNRWTYGPWIDTFGSPEILIDAARMARENNIPASALWAEDWIGKEIAMGGEHLTYDWEEDPDLYPDIEGLATTLHDMGFKFLTYINPMVASDTQVFVEGVEGGFLASDEDGHPIELEFPFGEPPSYYDMTVDGSLDWFWGYLGRAVDKGIDGWMHDYGESLPLDAVMGDGRSGFEVHNEYPLLWAEAGRAFWEMKRPGGDFAIFNRSGYTGISAHTHIMWLGDQLVTFDRNDGLGSVPRLYLSAGLSGIALTHSDIGGYTSFGSSIRTYELWARWVTLETFTPFMRTHHSGTPAPNLQWSSNEDTLNHYRKYGQWHQRLLPYWTQVVDEAVNKGAPAVRPVWWNEVDPSALFDVDDAFLVGNNLLVAPIVEEGVTSRSVKLPSGTWHRWNSVDALSPVAQTGTVTVSDVGAEDAIVFIRGGSVLALLSENYDTTAQFADGVAADINAAPAVMEEVTLRLVPGGDDAGTLSEPSFGQISYVFSGSALGTGAMQLGGAALGNCASESDTMCMDGNALYLALDEAGQSIELSSGDGTGSLQVSGSFSGRLRIELFTGE
ncbi:MAG: hypothetical protein HOI23_21885 [Deltaproteobacteria bacterium]|nr:hypothetical protein [Deltaproteobacteria bacterium]